MATLPDTKDFQNLKEAATSFVPGQITDRRLNIVLLGPPGAGKGTQAQKLCKHFNLRHIATGDLFRDNLIRQTELGELAKKYMDRGELVPDDVTGAMVHERLSRPDINAGFLLDGFPRTLPQAEALTNIMTYLKRRVTGVLYIKVPRDELVDRLSRRRICRKCQIPFHELHSPFQRCPIQACQGEHLYRRDDDNPKTVRARLQTFRRETAPLIDYYQRHGLLIEINGNRDITEVTQKAIAAVERLLSIGGRVNG